MEAVERLTLAGMPYPLANEVVRGIDRGTNAETFVAHSVSYPAAIELARQIEFYEPNAEYLAQSGFEPSLAKVISDLIGASGHAPPAALGWPATVNGKAIPQRFRLVDGIWEISGDFDARTLVNDAIWTNPPLFVDGTKANNNGDASSEANAKRDINAAITTGNATNAPYRIYVKGGDYRTATSITGGSGVNPTQPCALIAYDGKVNHAARDLVTWADDGTGNNTYTATTNGVQRAFDMGILDSYGDYTELTLAADLATCRATPGTYFKNVSVIHVHRANNGVVSDSTVRLYKSTPVGDITTGDKDLYFGGDWDFEGGQNGAIYISAKTTARNIVFDGNCTFKYAGYIGSLQDGLRIERVNGFVFKRNCTTSKAAKDGDNEHGISSPPSNMYSLTLNCRAYDNGYFGSTSVNGWTRHNDCISIDVGGRYEDSGTGPVVHDVDAAKSYMLGTTSIASARSGAIPTCFQNSDSTIRWMERCTGTGTRSLYAQTGSTILHRNCTFSGTLDNDGGAGTIRTF